MPKSIVVTGVNRGIGRELARRLADEGNRVVGTVRNPDAVGDLRDTGLTIERLEVADEESVAAFAQKLRGAPVDTLIHNAAIGEAGPPLEGLSSAALEDNYRVNTIGPIRLTQALLPNLRAGSARQVIGLSSTLGSVSSNETQGGWYAYRASKAALNQLFRTMALALRPEGFTFVLVYPGWVRTDMGGPRASLSVAESVEGMTALLKRLTPADTSRFLDYRGEPIPW